VFKISALQCALERTELGKDRQFAGEVIGFSDDEYIIRDPEKLKWLRAEGELSFAKPAKKEAA